MGYIIKRYYCSWTRVHSKTSNVMRGTRLYWSLAAYGGDLKEHSQAS